MAQNPYGNPPQTPGGSDGPIYVAPTHGTAEYGAASPAEAPQAQPAPQAPPVVPETQPVTPPVVPAAPQASPLAPHVAPPAPPQYRTAPIYSPPKGLALTSLLLGIGGLLAAWIPGLNILVIPAAIVAVILGIVALKKRQPRGLAITGIILGAIVLLVIVIGLIGLIIFMSSNPGVSI